MPRSESLHTNSSAQAKPSKSRSMFRKEAWWGYLFIAPPFIGVAVFLLYPLLYSLYISFSTYDFSSSPEWTGTSNYEKLLVDDPLVWKTLGNTFYSALGVPLGIVVSMLIAILLNQKIRGRNFFRILFFLPTICSIVAMALIWQWIFNSDYGILNYLLSKIGIQGPAWLSDANWSMPAMIFQGVWGGLGVNIILYLAAFGGVSRSLYEAAMVDGASGWQKFRHITVPGISPVTFFILTTSLIGALQDFARFQLMTGGGPDFSTTTIVYYLYNTAFKYNDMGYASAVAWFIGVIIMIIVGINFLLSRRWVHYN